MNSPLRKAAMAEGIESNCSGGDVRDGILVLSVETVVGCAF